MSVPESLREAPEFETVDDWEALEVQLEPECLQAKPRKGGKHNHDSGFLFSSEGEEEQEDEDEAEGMSSADELEVEAPVTI